jgi:transaldolase
MNKLETLKEISKVVVDTGDFNQIDTYKPTDATTNPSLLLQAAMMPEYFDFVNKIVRRKRSLSGYALLHDIIVDLAVEFGIRILKMIPGKVSTEVDARLSFDIDKTISYAHTIISKYRCLGIDKSKVLIKIPATWEGIQAAAFLEKEDIRCNLTLVFDLIQAIVCAENNIYLISPFVGRITDWYMSKRNKKEFPTILRDNGILSVKEIFSYYKTFNYNTVVMAASFRHTTQVEALAGCDALTIAPSLLKKIKLDEASLCSFNNTIVHKTKEKAVTENLFRWRMNQNSMAYEKLGEGIRKFANDTHELENFIKNKYQL